MENKVIDHVAVEDTRFVLNNDLEPLLEIRDSGDRFSHIRPGDTVLVMLTDPAFYTVRNWHGKWLILEYAFPVIGLSKDHCNVRFYRVVDSKTVERIT